MIIPRLSFLCGFTISFASEILDDSLSASPLPDNFEISGLATPLQNSDNLFTAPAPSEDTAALAFPDVPPISEDSSVSSNLFDLNSVEADSDLFSNEAPSLDLFAPLGPPDSGSLPELSLPTTETPAGDMQNLAFLDDIPKFPFPLNPIDILQGIQDMIPDFGDWGDLFPDKSKPPYPPVCEAGYHPLCCLEGAPNRSEGKEDRRGKCYTYSIDLKACEEIINHFCCICKDLRRRGYGCYNPHLSGPPILGPDFKKRSTGSIKRSEPLPPDASQGDDNNPSSSSSSRGKGRPREDDSCTDEYLRSIGVIPMKQYDHYQRKTPGAGQGSDETDD